MTVPPGAWSRDRWRTHEGPGWRIDLPVGVTGGVVAHTNPDLTTLAVFRGYVEEHPLYAAVTVRRRAHGSLRDELRALSAHLHAGPSDGAALAVPGARGARRADGLMDVEEGYGEPPRWTERVTLVAAAVGRHDLLIVTVRRHPAATLDDVVARSIESLRLQA